MKELRATTCGGVQLLVDNISDRFKPLLPASSGILGRPYSVLPSQILEIVVINYGISLFFLFF